MNDSTKSLFDDNDTWPGLVAENNLEIDPKFTDTDMRTWVSSEIAKWATEHRNTSADTTWGKASSKHNYDEHKGVDILNGISWPLPESMAYTDAILLTAGHDGFPVGNLNWDSALRAQYVEPSDITDVDDDSKKDLPNKYSLSQNYPNPFNPSTLIEFSIPNRENVKLEVYNAIGQKISTILNQEMSAGNNSFSFDASNLSSGIYYYTIKSGNFSASRKMILLK